MIKVENTVVMNFEGTLRGMRNPLNSWHRADSYYEGDRFVMGANDLDLAKRLVRAGSDHRKFLRQIIVNVDITAPLYWWKEFDTYKVGTVANSCSTMHKIHSKPIELSDFSIDNFEVDEPIKFSLNNSFKNTIADCEYLRQMYMETKDKRYWRGLIQLLPSSYNQKRTVTLNYEVLRNIYKSRAGHRLSEWKELRNWIEELPYAADLITDSSEN